MKIVSGVTLYPQSLFTVKSLMNFEICFKMSEFHFEDPDLKNSTLEIGFPSCAIEMENFIDPQGKQIRTENKESFQAEVRKQRAHLRCRYRRRPSC